MVSLPPVTANRLLRHRGMLVVLNNGRIVDAFVHLLTGLICRIIRFRYNL